MCYSKSESGSKNRRSIDQTALNAPKNTHSAPPDFLVPIGGLRKWSVLVTFEALAP